MVKETVGKVATDLLKKDPETRDPIEIQRASEQDYIDNLIKCIEENKSKLTDDFYIVVITKKEPLLENVLRNFFFARQACPTPDYDQAVYRYLKEEELCEFLWVIPSKDACLYFLRNANQVAPEEQQLLDFVVKFSDGTLMKWCKMLNKERSDSPLIEQ